MTNPHESSTPDYRIDSFTGADKDTENNFASATISDDGFVRLADHHSADGRDSYFVFFDTSALWGVPGAAEYLSLHITRDPEQRTYDFEHAVHPVLPLAQNWVIQRGCPEDAITVASAHGPRPADAQTSRLEDKLRANVDGRYEVLAHFTDNPGAFDAGVTVTTVLYDSHPDSADAPYRLFLEETTKDFATYTVREGAFTSEAAARTWTPDGGTPLPEPSSGPARRADAARRRSVRQPHEPASPPTAPPRLDSSQQARPRRGAR
ncbi:hypothetical protein [Streptomyces sp. Da 82-17]|uniref:hypothetical protein n=1 Tax=Streptomyces sp. Da 82-17 TaxID=3377116 RepID=UPI0038D4650E